MLADLGVVFRKFLEHNPALTAGEADNLLGELEHRDFVGVPDIDRLGDIGDEEAVDAVDEIVDVTDAPRLAPVAEDRDILAAERLGEEGRESRSAGGTNSFRRNRIPGQAGPDACGHDARQRYGDRVAELAHAFCP